MPVKKQVELGILNITSVQAERGNNMDVKACRRQGKTWFPKDKKCLDLNFKIRDPKATKRSHARQIQRLREKGTKFDDILPKQARGPDYTGERAIDERLQRDAQYLYSMYKSKEWQKCNQKVAKELKTRINMATRDEIKFQLAQEQIPESLDTAFYMLYYGKTNNLMKKVLKDTLWCE